MSSAIPTGKELNSGNKTLANPFGLGGQQSWLSPFDWKKKRDNLTGDTSTDMRQGLARYGFHAAPWMPALAYESMKKGDALKDQREQEAIAAENQGRFDAAQPYQRDAFSFQGKNPFLQGQYNQMANLLATQASPVYGGINGRREGGPRFGINPPRIPGMDDEERMRIMGGLL